MQGFGRTKLVGFGGLAVVVVLVIFIALRYGSGARPQGALIAIFALIFTYMFTMLATQRADLRRAAAADERAAQAEPSEIVDPISMSPTDLAAAMAVEPVDGGAIAARRRAWGLGLTSIRSGAILVVLIALAVVPWELYQWKWSLIVVVPVIMIYVVYLSIRLLAGGAGSIKGAYQLADAMYRPLGLEMVDRPKLSITPSIARPSYDTEMRGALVMEGNRHGRDVRVSAQTGGDTVTTVGAELPEFAVRAKGERLCAPEGSPAKVVAVLDALRPSSHWKGVSADAGGDGITVIRTKDAGSEWLWDLWLAERLADALG